MFTPPNKSCVTCHMSHVTCHMSHVTCHMSHVTSGEAYQWRVCYQRGLPRLVSKHLHSQIIRARELTFKRSVTSHHLSCVSQSAFSSKSSKNHKLQTVLPRHITSRIMYHMSYVIFFYFLFFIYLYCWTKW